MPMTSAAPASSCVVFVDDDLPDFCFDPTATCGAGFCGSACPSKVCCDHCTSVPSDQVWVVGNSSTCTSLGSGPASTLKSAKPCGPIRPPSHTTCETASLT